MSEEKKNTFFPPHPPQYPTRRPKGKSHHRNWREKAIQRDWFTYSFPNQVIESLPLPANSL